MNQDGFDIEAFFRAIPDLDAIDGNDPEAAHAAADAILLRAAAPDIRAAYERVASRCHWWASA